MANRDFMLKLFDAADADDLLAIKTLLNKFKEDDIQNSLGNYRLREVIQWIDRGADVNTIQIAKKNTPLMLAASHGNLEAVKKFLELGANIRHCDDYGKTALDDLSYGNANSDADFVGILQAFMKYDPEFILSEAEKSLYKKFDQSSGLSNGVKEHLKCLLNSFFENYHLEKSITAQFQQDTGLF